MALPGSGELSIGMLNFEIASGGSSTTRTNQTETSQGDMAALAANYSANAESEGEEGASRANLLAGPYGMDEFYGYTYNACVLVGTEIFMACPEVTSETARSIADFARGITRSGTP